MTDSVIYYYYSQEQKLRKAWTIKHGSLAGYHKATDKEKRKALNETNNN